MKTKAEEFIWDTRYSNTDEPDYMGRWARLLIYKGMLFAWVNRDGYNKPDGRNDILFTIHGYFPINRNDMPQYVASASTFEEAKELAEAKLREFIIKMR